MFEEMREYCYFYAERAIIYSQSGITSDTPRRVIRFSEWLVEAHNLQLPLFRNSRKELVEPYIFNNCLLFLLIGNLTLFLDFQLIVILLVPNAEY